MELDESNCTDVTTRWARLMRTLTSVWTCTTSRSLNYHYDQMIKHAACESSLNVTMICGDNLDSLLFKQGKHSSRKPPKLDILESNDVVVNLKNQVCSMPWPMDVI